VDSYFRNSDVKLATEFSLLRRRT
jgi:hypothetical protein